MKPNGRRAWRVAAKKLRRKIGRRVRDLDHRSTPISGAWFRRHGFTMDDPRYQIRQYIGTCGTVDGDGVEFAIKPASFTPRSLVGMTQGARKRKAWAAYQTGISESWSHLCDAYRIGERLRPCPGCWNCQTTWQQSSIYSQTAVMHRHGCSHDDPSGLCCFGETVPVKMECDGSGVLPARNKGNGAFSFGAS